MNKTRMVYFEQDPGSSSDERAVAGAEMLA